MLSSGKGNVTDDQVLILYSSPSGAERLRIDKEHRSIDTALPQQARDRIVRLHAPTFDDVVTAIRLNRFTLLQFSGHGEAQGILLETPNNDGGLLLDITRICMLLRLAAPDLKAAIFMSCFSYEMRDLLIQEVPYLVAISGPANDDACIEFSTKFYSEFFQTGSVVGAYRRASVSIQFRANAMDAVLLRRGLGEYGKRALIVPDTKRGLSRRDDVDLLIDISRVETDIERIGVPREKFLTLIGHKIRIHRWAFRFPRDNALFSIGPYFGLFSWENAYDVVTCNRIMKLRADADEAIAELWAGLMISYHDAYVEDYRAATAGAIVSASVKEGLQTLNSIDIAYFRNETRASVLRRGAPEVFRAVKTQVAANLDVGNSKFHQNEENLAVSHLEAALSAIHDLIDALAENLLE
jgi:hypothetical protein